MIILNKQLEFKFKVNTLSLTISKIPKMVIMKEVISNIKKGTSSLPLSKNTYMNKLTKINNISFANLFASIMVITVLLYTILMVVFGGIFGAAMGSQRWLEPQLQEAL